MSRYLSTSSFDHTTDVVGGVLAIVLLVLLFAIDLVPVRSRRPLSLVTGTATLVGVALAFILLARFSRLTF